MAGVSGATSVPADWARQNAWSIFFLRLRESERDTRLTTIRCATYGHGRRNNRTGINAERSVRGQSWNVRWNECSHNNACEHMFQEEL